MTVWSRTATGELHTWEEVSSSLPERNLLLGNGASRAIWADFKYESLLRRACAAIPHPLTPKQQRVFRALQTENFEAVLTALGDAKRVARALDLDGRPIADAYIATRDALITAVSGAHVPWGDALAAPLRRTKAEFSNHSKIFTTNYDLLSYWAVMVDGPRGVR